MRASLCRTANTRRVTGFNPRCRLRDGKSVDRQSAGVALRPAGWTGSLIGHAAASATQGARHNLGASRRFSTPVSYREFRVYQLSIRVAPHTRQDWHVARDIPRAERQWALCLAQSLSSRMRRLALLYLFPGCAED